MSELIMYAVRDKAVEAFMRPFFFQSDGQALRAFIDDVQNADSPIARHPEDYALFRLGVVDCHDGSMSPEEPKCLARAHELVKKSRQIQPGSLKGVN